MNRHTILTDNGYLTTWKTSKGLYSIEISIGRWKRYGLNGYLHRVNGPAVLRSNGTKEWYLNGKPHRENGPALEWSNGSKEWYRNGIRHREDGAAVEYVTGHKHWYLNGCCYHKEAEYTIALNELKQKRL